MRHLLVCLLIAGSVVLYGCGREDTGTADVDDTSEEYTEEYPEDDTYSEPVETADTFDDPSTASDPADQLRVITDLDGDTQLILTDTRLLMLLTAEATAARTQGLTSRGFSDELKDAIKEGIKDAVREEAKKATDKIMSGGGRRLRIEYPLQQVLDMRFANGRLYIEVEREKRLSFDDIRSRDGQPVLDNFDDDEARRFADTFEQLRS